MSSRYWKARTGGVALLVLAISGFGFAQWKSTRTRASAPNYTLSPVVRGDVTLSVNTTGQLSPWASVEVSTQVSGLVQQVTVDFNTPVKKGQILAVIDPSIFRQKLRQAEANLAAMQANQSLAESNATRLIKLRGKDLVTQQEYDQAAAQQQQSAAALLVSRAEVENARVDLDRCTITSPIDGVVIYKQVEVGKTVVSSFSAPTLFVIAPNLTRMRVVAPISEVDIWAVQPGQAVTFTVDALPGRTFSGRLTQIRDPYVPSDRPTLQLSQRSAIASFEAVIEVDNTDRLLRPSLTVNVAIVVQRHESVLLVPNGALRVELPSSIKAIAPSTSGARVSSPSIADASSAATIYRLAKDSPHGVAESVTVTLGISDSIVTEVDGDLREGDQIITGFATPWEPEEKGLALF